MEEASINWLAVIAAAIVAFGLGAIWYGPLFGKRWMTVTGITEEAAQKGNMALIMGLGFIFELAMAFCLAMFLGTEVDAPMGAFYGFLAGFFWVALAMAVNALFERKSWTYILINGGYWTVVFTLMGLILGAWG